MLWPPDITTGARSVRQKTYGYLPDRTAALRLTKSILLRHFATFWETANILASRLEQNNYADTRTLLVLSRTRINFGKRVFSAAGQVWNYLLTDLRQLDLSYSRSRQSLKTLLIVRAERSVNPRFITL